MSLLMYQPISLFIGLRYIIRGTEDRFGRFISWLSVIGIALGMLALITMLSIMNGFERELENNILGMMPQAIVISDQKSLDPKQFPSEKLKLQGVQRIVPITNGDIVLQSKKDIAVGVMLGIEPNEVDPLTPWAKNINQQSLQAGKYNMIIGEQLAMQLGVKKGDQLRLMVPSAGYFTPIGYFPSQRLFNVIGTYSTNSEIDNYQILVNLQDASCLMRYPIGNITGWRLWLDNPLEIDKISRQKLPKGMILKDWRERKGNLFQAIQMERNIMCLLLGLIIAISTFNIITSLSLLIMEKQSEVAILQTQGLTRNQTMFIFMVCGTSLGIIGTFLGVLLSYQLNKSIPEIGNFFAKTVLPVDISFWQITIITLITMILTLLSTLYPSWRATTIQPAKALRYE